MAITELQLSQLNFGYLNGLDLCQYCPPQLLISQYNKFPNLLQNGVDQASDEVIGELCNRYDVNKELSNYNQLFLNKTGSVPIFIAAGSYVSRIVFNWNGVNNAGNIQSVDNNALLAVSGILQNIELAPNIQIGTTPGGSDIISNRCVNKSGLVVWINRLYPVTTTIYLTIANGNVDIEVSATTNVATPPQSVMSSINQTGNFTISIPANTYIFDIFAQILLATPTIQIGATFGASDIVASTTVSNAMLTLLNQYYDNDTVLYCLVTNGSVNLRLDVGLNFVAPVLPSTNVPRNSFLVKILSIFAIRNILGSLSGENKQLMAHYDWAVNMIEKIKERQVSLTLQTAPSALRGRNETIEDRFKTLG